MEKRYYNAASLEHSLQAFERRYSLESAEFYAAHIRDDSEIVGHIPRWHRHSWASFYREWQQVSSGHGRSRRSGKS